MQNGSKHEIRVANMSNQEKNSPYLKFEKASFLIKSSSDAAHVLKFTEACTILEWWLVDRVDIKPGYD